MRDASGTERAAVLRQKTNGRLKVDQGSSSIATTTVLPLSAWKRVALHVVGGASGRCTVEVYLDGVLIYRTTTATLNATAFSSLTVGPTSNVLFNFAADAVSASFGG